MDFIRSNGNPRFCDLYSNYGLLLCIPFWNGYFNDMEFKHIERVIGPSTDTSQAQRQGPQEEEKWCHLLLPMCSHGLWGGVYQRNI